MKLQERLRSLYVQLGTNYVQEAADRIDALEFENERLRKLISEMSIHIAGNCDGKQINKIKAVLEKK